MKTLKRLCLILATAITATINAATLSPYPAAVWDGDFSTLTQGDYTLDLNSNSLSEDNATITIDQSVGVTVDFTTAIAGNITILVKYSDLSLTTQETLFSQYSSSYYNRTGIYLKNTGVPYGIWNNAVWDNVTTGTAPTASGVLAFAYGYTDATYLYQVASGSATQIYYASGLKSGSDSSIGGCAIFGERGSASIGAATGAKITGIAIFNWVLSAEYINAFIWPSDTVDYSVTVSSDTTWSKILSEAGITEANMTNASLTVTAENSPTITFDKTGTLLYALTIDGEASIAVEESSYDEDSGCFGTSLVTTAHGITASDLSFGAVSSGWKGSFHQSWNALALYAQNTETISINIGGGSGTADASSDAYLVTGDDYYGLYPAPGTAWNNISGQWQGTTKTVTLTSATAFDGDTTTTRNTIQLSGTAYNTWLFSASEPYLCGYLDDSTTNYVTIVGVPYSKYDVVVYATSDSSNYVLSPFVINGTVYTCDSDGVATELSSGLGTWGAGAQTTAAFGKNAMLIKDVTGSSLTVSGGKTYDGSSLKARATVCAVQIINRCEVESSDWSANLNSTTTWDGGTGDGFSDQSGTWANNSLASLIITNLADDATLTLNTDITAGTLKVVGEEGKSLTLAKSGDPTLDIPIYDFTESAEEVVFTYDPDFSKVNPGDNLIGVGYDVTGTISKNLHYLGDSNELTLGTISGGALNLGGSGTITGDLGIEGSSTATISGTYTSSSTNTMLGAILGTLNIAEGASITVPHVRLSNSDTAYACTMNVDGALVVDSVSTSYNAYSDRNNYLGILFGHWHGSSTVNVGETGSITGVAAWLQMSYTCPGYLNIDGGSVKVRGINGGPSSTTHLPTLTLTGGGTIEIAEGFVNADGLTREYGYGTIKTYSYDGSYGWSDPGAISFTDADNGTTIDPCGMTNNFTGTLSGAGKIIISDSVGGGIVTFADASALTGTIMSDSNTTLNLGMSRPTGTLTVEGTLTVALASKSDVPVFNVSAKPPTVVVYDTDGTTVLSGATTTYDEDAGTLTVKPPVNRWYVDSSASVSFDSASNWSSTILPTSNQDIAIIVTNDVTLSISGTYSGISSLTVSGAGVVSFTGSGSVTADTVYLADGATLARDSRISTSDIELASGTVLRLTDTTESAVISGAGAVETYGDVTMAAANTFTGGITAKSGTLSTTTATGFSGYGGDATRLITVEDGACVDIANTKDYQHQLVIAGNGVLSDGKYSGAVKNSGSDAYALGNRQTSAITLTADALVDVSTGWGIVRSGYAEATLVLNGHTLTMRGTGTVPMAQVNSSSSTGTIVLDGPTLYLGSDNACNLTGTTIIAKGCSSINLATAPSALASLTIAPDTEGTTATAWNLPSSCVPVVNTSNIDPSAVSVGDTLTLFTDNTSSLVYGSNITYYASGRYTIGNDSSKVTATVTDLKNFLHYNFDSDTVSVSDSAAADSTYLISEWGDQNGDGPFAYRARNGQAAHIFYTDDNDRLVPYWGSTTAGISAFHAGELTVTAVAKLDAANRGTALPVWGLGSSYSKGIALVADSKTQVSVISWTGSYVKTLATISGLSDITTKYHFYAVVTSASGTTLYIDNESATSTETAYDFGTDQSAQIGSLHGGALSDYPRVANGDGGFYLDDWQVYDAALTKKEIRAIKCSISPDPFYIRLR